jgi:hypothetical protein
MSQMGFEPTTTVFEPTKTVLDLDRAATAIGATNKFQLFNPLIM